MVKPIAVGDTVWAKWPGSSTYFKATVSQLEVDKKVKLNGYEAVMERKHMNVSWSTLK